MNKGNAWPWVISLCIHAIVLYFLFSQSIKVARPKEEKNAIIQAYVTVNLASLPKLSSVVTTTNAPDIKPVNTKTDAPNSATSNTTPIKKDSTKAPKKKMMGGKKKMMKGGKKKMMGGKKMMYKSGGFLEMPVFDLDRD